MPVSVGLIPREGGLLSPCRWTCGCEIYIKDNSKANFIIEEYLIEIDRLRKKYPELKILKGIEFSEPHLFKKEFERYSQYPFDYILGSVHHCYEGVFPGAANISEDEAIKEYYDIMIRSLEECFFDGMAHLDFPRSFFDHWNISETIINRILELMVEKYRAVYQQNCVFNG